MFDLILIVVNGINCWIRVKTLNKLSFGKQKHFNMRQPWKHLASSLIVSEMVIYRWTTDKEASMSNVKDERTNCINPFRSNSYLNICARHKEGSKRKQNWLILYAFRKITPNNKICLPPCSIHIIMLHHKVL